MSCLKLKLEIFLFKYLEFTYYHDKKIIFKTFLHKQLLVIVCVKYILRNINLANKLNWIIHCANN